MKSINWTQVVVFAVIVFLVFAIGMSLLGTFWGGGQGMMGGWGPGGMMGGWGGGWMLMWLFPLGFLVLLILGVVWLARSLGGAGRGWPQAQAGQVCPECHRFVQNDWQVCPYCGKGLSQDSVGE